MTFEQLELATPLLRALQDEGYQTPTPIQQKSIPTILHGEDLLGCAQTGTGKTAAFALPILQNLAKKGQHNQNHGAIKALILTPTRELAIQVDESFRTYGKYTGLKNVVIYGGVSQFHQEKNLRRGADILVATPGRLLDLIGQRIIRLDSIEIFVLDEADRMLDMGFINDIRKIVKLLPQKRQNLFFSATMPVEIRSLADSILSNPVQVEVASISSTADTVSQHICLVEKENKKDLLKHLLSASDVKNALIFTRTKHGADKVSRDLNRSGIHADAIHGNKAQNARQRALDNFKAGKIRVLVATDIAARGIDVEGISHVINYELPNEPETYVHRIGRTGRAGAQGLAISFCAVDERTYLRDIQKLTKQDIPVLTDHPYASSFPMQSLSSVKTSYSESLTTKKRTGGGGNWRRRRGLRMA